MAGTQVDFLWLPRCRTITGAIIRGAKIRAAFDDLRWRLSRRNPHLQYARSAWIDRLFRGMTWHIPVARPLPNVTDHVVKSVPIGWEAAYRRDACITVLFSIVDRKDALPGIGDGLAIFIEGLTPVLTLVAAATR